MRPCKQAAAGHSHLLVFEHAFIATGERTPASTASHAASAAKASRSAEVLNKKGTDGAGLGQAGRLYPGYSTCTDLNRSQSISADLRPRCTCWRLGTKSDDDDNGASTAFKSRCIFSIENLHFLFSKPCHNFPN